MHKKRIGTGYPRLHHDRLKTCSNVGSLAFSTNILKWLDHNQQTAKRRGIAIVNLFQLILKRKCSRRLRGKKRKNIWHAGHLLPSVWMLSKKSVPTALPLLNLHPTWCPALQVGSGRIGNCVFTLCTWLEHFYNDCVVLTDELCLFRQVPVLWNAILLHEVGCENLKNVTGHILNIWKMRIHFWFVGQPQLVEPVQFTYFEILRFISTTLFRSGNELCCHYCSNYFTFCTIHA